MTTYYNMQFNATQPTELCILMGNYGSDKGHQDLNSSPHNYSTLYYKILQERRHEPLRIFELGLGTNNVNLPSNMGPNGKPGASLKAWTDFFPNSAIYGADIDSAILFTQDRIQTYYCDQTDPASIRNLWENHPDLQENFDFIVEDGLHTYQANVTFFENSIHKLRQGGYYIIEDVYLLDIPQYEQVIETKWKVEHPHLEFHVIRFPLLEQTSQMANNIVLVHWRA